MFEPMEVPSQVGSDPPEVPPEAVYIAAPLVFRASKNEPVALAPEYPEPVTDAEKLVLLMKVAVTVCPLSPVFGLVKPLRMIDSPVYIPFAPEVANVNVPDVPVNDAMETGLGIIHEFAA